MRQGRSRGPSMKKVGTVAGSATSSPSSTHSRKPGQRPAHRARADRRPDRHAGEGAGLGLPVAVVDRDAGAPPATRRRSRGSAARRRRPRGAAAARAAWCRLAMARYSVGAMHSTSTPSRSITSSRSAGSKRASCISAVAPADPGGDERVAGGLRPAAGRGAPAQVALAGAEPVLGLGGLPGQVALAVADRLGLARGARGEHDQRRVARGRAPPPGRARPRTGRSSGTRSSSPVEARLLDGRRVALVGDHRPRLHGVHPRPQVRGPQLLGAGQRHRADPEAGHHRQDPLRAVADDGHHHVPPAYSALLAGSRRNCADRRAISPKVSSAREPSAPSATSAIRSGIAFSTTSAWKFTAGSWHATFVAKDSPAGGFAGERQTDAERTASLPATPNPTWWERGTQGGRYGRWGELSNSEGAQALSARARQLTP